jgi:hypothetical protein
MHHLRLTPAACGSLRSAHNTFGDNDTYKEHKNAHVGAVRRHLTAAGHSPIKDILLSRPRINLPNPLCDRARSQYQLQLPTAEDVRHANIPVTVFDPAVRADIRSLVVVPALF